jgi:C4-dicarboxylate transporter, DctM subunit
MIWIGLFLFGLFFLFLLLEVPVALSLGLSSMLAILVFQLQPPIVIPQQIFSGMDSYNLLAIPLFLAAGHLLGESLLAKRLIDFILIFAGRMRGGAALVTVIASIFFAGISGSGPADVAALGVLLYPLMTESGFAAPRAAALLAAGGGIGIIIPPSIALIIYGVVANASISRLFLAGVFPGILVGVSLIAAILLLSRKDQLPANIPRLTASTIGGAILAAIAPVIILGGIYLGVFTPTESAAAAVLYILAADLIFYRSLFDRTVIMQVLVKAGRSTAQILMIIAGGSLFSWVLLETQLSPQLSQLILTLTENRIALLLLINAFLLVMGCFIDAVSIIYIFVPIFMPVIPQIGVDPVHFGIILTVNMAIGQITPPVGVNLFVASSISGVKLGQICRAVIPFVIAEIAALLIITLFPSLSLFLPAFLIKAAP